MTKKKNELRPLSVVRGIIGLIVLVIAFVVLQLSGVDILGTQETPTPTFQTPVPATRVAVSGDVRILTVGLGSGAEKGFWQVYFSEPTGNSDRSTYVNGIDVPLAAAIDNVQNTLDIAAFEMNNTVIVDAIKRAHARGVTVRIVTDDEHGIEDTDGILLGLADLGIEVVDDDRTALMHDKFMIMDGIRVWTGSWNYTENGTYRNDNNALMLQAIRVAEVYQTEFDEMFEDERFGSTSPAENVGNLTLNGTPVEIMFGAENDVIPAIQAKIANAQRQVRFMTFVFSDDALGQTVLQAKQRGLDVAGIFENRNSTADWSELPLLFCNGVDVRQDGNPFTLHHKVFIVDDTVITGSFNFSDNAASNNDENVIIITDPDLANLYLQEFSRIWAQSRIPQLDSCP